MASEDPNGNTTTGITRTATSQSSFSTNDGVKYSSSGGVDAWNTSEYLNIWVCDLSGGLLGYAQFPGGTASSDGVVCDYAYFGNMGTATPPYDQGRTLTHEIGHWLNLRHIWGTVIVVMIFAVTLLNTLVQIMDVLIFLQLQIVTVMEQLVICL